MTILGFCCFLNKLLKTATKLSYIMTMSDKSLWHIPVFYLLFEGVNTGNFIFKTC